jgi:hypothetical protein
MRACPNETPIKNHSSALGQCFSLAILVQQIQNHLIRSMGMVNSCTANRKCVGNSMSCEKTSAWKSQFTMKPDIPVIAPIATT